MNTQEFLDLIKAHPDKSLLFKYGVRQLVGANYHITEVKHTKIESVDCGAGTSNWNETLVQLWESPADIDKKEYMSAYKALGILTKVGKMVPYDMNAVVKFEYGNALFHTAQFFVDGFEILGNNLIVNLSITKTDCKAKEACGIPQEAVLETATNVSCAPGSGCC